LAQLRISTLLFARAFIDTRNLESVFVAFEMATLLGKFPNIDERRISELSRAMVRVIVDTLEATILYWTVPLCISGLSQDGSVYCGIVEACRRMVVPMMMKRPGML
jgi:hypothetical protein